MYGNFLQNAKAETAGQKSIRHVYNLFFSRSVAEDRIKFFLTLMNMFINRRRESGITRLKIIGKIDLTTIFKIGFVPLDLTLMDT